MATTKSLKQNKVSSNSKPKKEVKRPAVFSPQMIGQLADEVSKTLMTRLPGVIMRPRQRLKSRNRKQKKVEMGIFLDTSAIIDGRIFDVIYSGLLNGSIVIISSILLELKHLADSQDTVKRERGRKGLLSLEKLKKSRKMKVVILDDEDGKESDTGKEVDEKLIRSAKDQKGKVITCDYNLEKKATIEGVTSININALANHLKVIAVPGESLHVNVSHIGKEATQGVGYLDDGTMIVVEEGREFVGRALDVVVARVIQTATGRILFAKKI